MKIDIKKIAFSTFRNSRISIALSTILSMLIVALMFWVNDLQAEDLRNLSGMTINTELVLSTLIISVIAMNSANIKKQEKTQELILGYIGSVLVAISIGALGYILSYVVNILPTNTNFTIKIYSMIMAMAIIKSITNSTKYIIEIFDVN